MFLGLCSLHSQKQHGCCFRRNAYKEVCFASVADLIKTFIRVLRTSCFGQRSDMYNYNLLYTHRLNWHVLPPELYYIKKLSNRKDWNRFIRFDASLKPFPFKTKGLHCPLSTRQIEKLPILSVV